MLGFKHARDALAYGVIMASAVAGFVGVGLWVFLAATAILVCCSINDHRELYRRAMDLGSLQAVAYGLSWSTLHAVLAVSAAGAMGWALQNWLS